MDAAAKGTRGRGGRPTAGNEKDVETRLLTAATRLFLTQGYEGTSCDQVASEARAGKASIYARYADKTALFSAVISHMLERSFMQDDIDADKPIDDRLASAGMQLLRDALHTDALALLRLLVAELLRLDATRVPAGGMFWEPRVARVSQVIAQRDLGAVAKAIGPATRFVDAVLAPLAMRALLGEALGPLLADGPSRIHAAIAMLHANHALDGWT